MAQYGRSSSTQTDVLAFLRHVRELQEDRNVQQHPVLGHIRRLAGGRICPEKEINWQSVSSQILYASISSGLHHHPRFWCCGWKLSDQTRALLLRGLPVSFYSCVAQVEKARKSKDLKPREPIVTIIAFWLTLRCGDLDECFIAARSSQRNLHP